MLSISSIIRRHSHRRIPHCSSPSLSAVKFLLIATLSLLHHHPHHPFIYSSTPLLLSTLTPVTASAIIHTFLSFLPQLTPYYLPEHPSPSTTHPIQISTDNSHQSTLPKNPQRIQDRRQHLQVPLLQPLHAPQVNQHQRQQQAQDPHLILLQR